MTEKNNEENIKLTTLNFENKDCDCCFRNFKSDQGRIMISGHFICAECLEKCEPTDPKCSITGKERTFD